VARPHLLTVAGAAADLSIDDAPLSRLTAVGESFRST